MECRLSCILYKQNVDDYILNYFTSVVLNREEEETADSLTTKPTATVDKIVVRTDDFFAILQISL